MCGVFSKGLIWGGWAGPGCVCVFTHKKIKPPPQLQRDRRETEKEHSCIIILNINVHLPPRLGVEGRAPQQQHGQEAAHRPHVRGAGGLRPKQHLFLCVCVLLLWVGWCGVEKEAGDRL